MRPTFIRYVTYRMCNSIERIKSLDTIERTEGFKPEVDDRFISELNFGLKSTVEPNFIVLVNHNSQYFAPRKIMFSTVQF